MNEMFLLKMGEIVLKGLNRSTFEGRLQSNLTRRLKPYGKYKIRLLQSTVYVEPEDEDCDLDGAWEACARVFGIAAMSRCRGCEKNLDDIYRACVEYLGDEIDMAKSFKVESKRADKKFPMTSIQISQEIGGRLAEEYPDTVVDVHNPDYTVYVEIREQQAYVHGPARLGAGGLPTGVGGKTALAVAVTGRVAGLAVVQADAARGDVPVGFVEGSAWTLRGRDESDKDSRFVAIVLHGNVDVAYTFGAALHGTVLESSRALVLRVRV